MMKNKNRINLRETRRLAAMVAVVGFAVLLVFQVLLASGAPLGMAAFGGASARLTPELRVMSAVSALLIVGAIWTVLARVGMIGTNTRTKRIAHCSLWGFAALFSLSALANFASSSPWERFGWAPFSVVIVICCVFLALDPKGA